MNFRVSRFPVFLFSLGILAAPFGVSAQENDFSVQVAVVHGGPETGFDSGLTSIGRLNTEYGTTGGGPSNVRSFPFTWTNLPAGTKALAVILDDPDAKPVMAAYGMKGDFFLHWIATDIDPQLGGLADNAAATLPSPQGMNGAGKVGYTAPAPPADVPKDTDKVRIHVYRLKVLALSAPTGLKPGFTLEDLLKAVEGKTLGTAQVNVSYSNQ